VNRAARSPLRTMPHQRCCRGPNCPDECPRASLGRGSLVRTSPVATDQPAKILASPRQYTPAHSYQLDLEALMSSVDVAND
jgi:hypothetical protein